ncbi:hypothetical protein [Marispirochaeta sp.]|uniref:hypothetical protein n=1 Tax=Marispirochaeta sp. TaxID=2038653 RepID=UPI0029C92CAA|nr:hypothetical protein [Marispirochaeta sp.]
MFGIGFGELLLALLVVFLVSPKDFPKFMKKAGEFIATGDRIRKEMFALRNEVVSIAENLEINEETVRKKNKDNPEEVSTKTENG